MIDNALEQEVAIAVKVEEVYAIYDTVYGVYKPAEGEYERRETSGGLADPSNMHTSVADNRLVVKNVTQPNPVARIHGEYTKANIYVNLPQLVEYGHGHGGFYQVSHGPWASPRPFTEATREALRSGKQHVSALKAGLVRQGLKVE